VTAVVISGIFKIAEAAGKPVPLTTDQVIKFGNYLVSRKTVTTPRGVFLLSFALDAISKNKHAVPVFVGLAGGNVLTDSNRKVVLRGSDLLGRALDISIVLESAVSVEGKKAPGVEFIQALQDKTDKTLFTIDLQTKPLPKGFFTLTLVPKSAKNDKALILQAATVQVKQVGKLGAVSARVGVQELDQQDHVTWTDLNKGQKLPAKLELEPAQKLVVKVAASDSLHQVFVLLRHKESQREVAFIAQPETSGKTDYKLELDLTSNAKDLNYQSGLYEVILYLGDFLIEDSTEWVLGDVQLTVFSGKPKNVNPLYSVSYGPKPEIHHQFRVPEPRPPRFLSDTFTLLVLAPLLVLLILWAKIGVNISAFPASISALGFHLGLAGIFGVYGIFWLKLSMFEALKIMTIPGLITFISGHRLLAYINERRTKGS
jgi:oligosaccharyltransferase complex subunit delta (ribophorin II)